MNTDYTFPTQSEIRGYEQAAHELRAEAVRDALKALFRMPKAAFNGLRSWAARPAHA